MPQAGAGRSGKLSAPSGRLRTDKAREARQRQKGAARRESLKWLEEMGGRSFLLDLREHGVTAVQLAAAIPVDHVTPHLLARAARELGVHLKYGSRDKRSSKHLENLGLFQQKEAEPKEAPPPWDPEFVRFLVDMKLEHPEIPSRDLVDEAIRVFRVI